MTPEQRAELIERRKTEFPAKYPGCCDFAPETGSCECGADLVAIWGRTCYPTAWITGCPSCHRSYCD